MFLNPKFSVNYISGVPNQTKPSLNYKLYIEKDGIKLKRFLKKDFKINWQSIIKISLESKGSITRSLSMGKSALGFLFLGPFGAILGAGLGKIHDDREYFISIDYKNEINSKLSLILQSEKAIKIVNVLINAQQKYFRKNNIITNDNKESNNLDQLEKIAQLKDKGIITEEEFQAKKKQILGL